jgi:hypothetical protein
MSGRPPLYDEEMQRIVVHVPSHLREFAEEVGDGTLSKGVRKILEDAYEENANKEQR